MGEGSKPELVTVQPLTRETGNHSDAIVSRGRGFGGSNRLIVIENIITLDGQIIDKRIRKSCIKRYWFADISK